MLVNIITIAVVTGFQNQVREKVIGFGSHAVISKSGETSIFESAPILLNQPFYPVLEKSESVSRMHPVAYKPALLQSDGKPIKGETEGQKEIQGVMIKGVSETYDWTFFNDNLIEGRVPKFQKDTFSAEILLSKRIAKNLNFKVGDDVRAFFVKNQPVRKQFKLVGIFETGLEDFDNEFVLADIKHIQQLNDWGIQASITVADTLSNGHLIVAAEVVGGNGNYRYDWGKGWDIYRGFPFYPTKDTILRCIVSDYWMFVDGKNEETTLADTAYLEVKVSGNKFSVQPYRLDSEKQLEREFTDDAGFAFNVKTVDKTISFTRRDGKGSFSNYIGGFECTLRDWDRLNEDVAFLKKQIQFQGNSPENQLKVTSIVDQKNDIFVWLSFLDINVWIILVLMILIGIINMGSALLVMILVKTSFIGLLKSMGATNWSIRKVFLYQAAFLILRGMFWGNLIGIGFCVLQSNFKLIKLNAEVYYLSAVPIEINWIQLLILNVATLVVCVIALILPSIVITRISPVKAIRFN
jgi:lipoprotein-releasing system permease protein